jgi:hypothetical protein
MTLQENMGDLEMHAREFTAREAFAYSVLDGDDVIGCVYIDPSQDPNTDARVRSGVTADRPDMDPVVWWAVTRWLGEVWPLQRFEYSARM